MLEKSEKIDKLITCLVSLQAEMGSSVPTDSTNPHFKNKYASLGAVIKYTKPYLAKYGLCVTQLCYESDKGPVLRTLLMHVSGEWIASSLGVRAKDNTAQAMGSGITYTRRYALRALLNLDEDDDDGNGAQPVQEAPREFKISDGIHRVIPSTAPPEEPPHPVEVSLQQAAPVILANLGEYKIAFGKWRGKSLKDIPLAELDSYVTYLCEMQAKDGKSSAGTRDFIVNAQKYISMKRAKAPSPMDGPDFQEEDLPLY